MAPSMSDSDERKDVVSKQTKQESARSTSTWSDTATGGRDDFLRLRQDEERPSQQTTSSLPLESLTVHDDLRYDANKNAIGGRS